MPWDSHLNQDIHSTHDQHVALTRHLPDNDPRKFSGSTPKRISESYHRLIEIFSSLPQIEQDCNRILDPFEAVKEARGCMVTKYGQRSGRRGGVSCGDTKRGGKREKQPYEPGNYLHPSVASVNRDMIGKSVTICNSDSSDDIDAVNLPIYDASTISIQSTEIDEEL